MSEADTSNEHGLNLRSSVLDAVSFDIEALIGDASLTLEGIEVLEPGSVVPLSTGLNGTVSLRLNGIEIARGELVSVDDKFAVKITDLPE